MGDDDDDDHHDYDDYYASGNDDWYSDYSNYIPTTIDTGNIPFTIALLYIIFLILSLFPTIYMGRKWKKYRKQKKIKFKQEQKKQQDDKKIEIMKQQQQQQQQQQTKTTTTATEKTTSNSTWLENENENETIIDVVLPSVSNKKNNSNKNNYTTAMTTDNDDDNNNYIAMNDNDNNDNNGFIKTQLLENVTTHQRSQLPQHLQQKLLENDNNKNKYSKKLQQGRASSLRLNSSNTNSSSINSSSNNNKRRTPAVLERIRNFVSAPQQPAQQQHDHDTTTSNRFAMMDDVENIVDGILDPDLPVEDKDYTCRKDKVEYIPHHVLEEHTALIYETSVLDTNIYSQQQKKAPGGGGNGGGMKNHQVFEENKKKKDILHSFGIVDLDDDIFEDEYGNTIISQDDAFDQYYKDHSEDASFSSSNIDDNNKNNNNNNDDDQDDEDENNYNNDGGGIQQIAKGCEKFRSVINPCDKESRKIFKIAAPATLYIISTLLTASTSAIISNRIGTSAFAAYALVGTFLGITDSFTSGVCEAESILISQAIGMNDYVMAGQYTQLTMVLYTFISIPTYIMWVYIAEYVVLLIGLSDDVVTAVQEYIPYAIFGYFLSGLGGGLSTLLWCDGHGTAMTIIDLIFHTLYVSVLAAFCFSVDQVHIKHVAYISIVYGIIYLSCTWSLAAYVGWLKPFHKGIFGKFAISNWNLVKGVLKMSLPMSLGSLLAYGEWETLTFFIATMGDAEVAAWYILGSIWSVFEYAPSGFSTATQIRVGYHLGNGNPGMAEIAAYKCLLFTTIWSCLWTIIFYCILDFIIVCFTDDPTLIAMLRDLTPLILVGNVLNCVGADAYYIITSQARAKLATLVSFLSSWAITLPLVVVCVVILNLDLKSVVCSAVIGYGTSCFAFIYLVFTSNWAKRSKKIIKRAKEADEEAIKRAKEADDGVEAIKRRAKEAAASGVEV